MDDLIYRQAAIDTVFKFLGKREIARTIQTALWILPSVQPEQPEWVQKVEEYRRSAPEYIHNPLAWALYQTWKEYDE